ncbi:Conjugation TrbI family protein [Thiomonas sp. X19]|uniref:TrbI/VirB10 family protein n=1 Tax=Thiomonas sp. X19 TaxID=1050370 RepID=UPI000B705539|nr:TrbI/VirB10 family protein [Thiomonas sp. X19]SCC93198.1 Conjugation TrbI family protein [Thiomonas sp. X19]
MHDAGQEPTSVDQALIRQDVDGGAAQTHDAKGNQGSSGRVGRVGIRIQGIPRLGGARLSKNFKVVAFIGGGALAGGMLLGVLTAGNRPKAAVDGASGAMVGQTRPDVDAMMRAAQRAAQADAARRHAGGTAPASGASSALRGGASQVAAALPAGGQASQLTPAQKYRQWLTAQHYKDLEGRVLAAQSAQVAQTSAAELGMMRGGPPRGDGASTADAWRRLSALAATPQGAADPQVQKALAALQRSTGLGLGETAEAQDSQDRNQAFLTSVEHQASSESAGYLDAVAQPPISDHELFAGSVIPAVMLSGIDSDLPGTITAQVRQTVYDSLHPDVVVIPQGTRIVGVYSSAVAYGQSRVLVAWDRLIFPDGAMIDLRGMAGTDGQGQAGFHDQVDNHGLRIFGSAVLMSLLGVGAQLSQPQNAGALNTPSASQQAAAALAQQMDNVGTNLLNKNLSIQPTLTIRPGYAFNVLVNRTMILPAYGGR